MSPFPQGAGTCTLFHPSSIFPSLHLLVPFPYTKDLAYYFQLSLFYFVLHISHIRENSVLCKLVCLMYLSTMISWYIHFSTGDSSLSFFMPQRYSFVHKCYTFFAYSSVQGHKSHFQDLPIINCNVINIRICASLQYGVFHWTHPSW